MFKGTGCAISVASSSLMTERVKGTTVRATLELFDKVHELLTGAGEHARRGARQARGARAACASIPRA